MPKGASQVSNDPDFVKPTKYTKNQGPLPDLPRQPPPEWHPLPIHNQETGRACLPEGVDASDPIALFDLFFSADILDKIAYHTNQHAEKLRADALLQDDALRPRGWKPTSPTELYTYFAIVIYMGLHQEPSLEEYWEKKHANAPVHSISNYMSSTRFQQTDRYLYCTEVEQSFESPFGRVWDLSEHIRKRSLELWHLCVDEAIARFTGRASEIVIIKTKPTPEGYKIWVLANDGVVLNWLFHAKGASRGPVNLNVHLAEMPAFTPTESVPISLVLAKDAADNRLFAPGRYIVWDDNLFNTVPMLEYLRKEGVGCAGTVRTTATRTEERFEDAARAEAQEPATRAHGLKKLSKERFNGDLVRLKTQFSHRLEWGEAYWALSANKTVLQAAWRDSQVVLFATTVADGTTYVERRRRRPAEASRNKKPFEKAFGNAPVKLLGIPEMIDAYNHHKSEVDRFDQTRSYYSTQRARRRTWRPLLYFLFDLTLNNIYRMSTYSTKTASKRGGHKNFLYQLIEQLFERGKRLSNGSHKRKRLDDVAPGEESYHSEPVRMWAESKTCIACSENGRTNNATATGRAPLKAISGNRNASRRTPRTLYGCKLCRVPLCRPELRPECWDEHLRRVNTIRSVDISISSTIK